MFSITLFVSPTTPIVLLYKSEETLNKAIAAYDSFDQMVMSGGSVVVVKLEDDFGQKLRVQKPVPALLIQDLKMSQQADIERGIHQAVTQAKAQERAKTEPALQSAIRAAQGPAVLSPMGMNGGPRGGF